MAELRNSLIYWGRSMEKYFMLMLVIPLATAVGMSVMSGEVDFEYILFYVPLIFSISILAIAFQNITAALSNIIALGATRKEGFLGMQISFHLLVLQEMIINAVILWLLPDVFAVDKITIGTFIAALFILACAFGNVINVVVMRSGMNKAKIVYIAELLVIAMIDIIVLQICEYIAIPFLGTISLIIMVFGIVLDVIASGMCNKAVKEYEVRV